MISFTSNDYPNFHLDIHNNDMTVVITLNITSDMVPFLSPNLVKKAKKRLSYVLKHIIPLQNITEQIILNQANILINTAMINCREAKQCSLDQQIERIKIQSPRLLPNNLFL